MIIREPYIHRISIELEKNKVSAACVPTSGAAGSFYLEVDII